MVILITGASTGIGAEFARQFAARGDDLVVVARSVDKLDHLAAQLRQAHGVNVTVVEMDLSAPSAAADLWRRTTELGIDVDVLVNNAGFGTHSDIADSDPARLEDAIELNCRTLVGATARYLPAMRARGRGAIINIASTAAFQPLPKMAVYGATKAFVLSFTEALWQETKSTGVRVFALCPGATETEFFARTGEEFLTSGRQTSQQVVDTAMATIDKSTPTVVSGLKNSVLASAYRFTPRKIMLSVSQRIMEAN